MKRIKGSNNVIRRMPRYLRKLDDLNAAGIERSITGRGPRTEVYYCHPYRPSERGSNENQNGLIRRHLPKGTDLSTIPYEETKRIEDWLNNYPRKMFGFLCSEQLFREEIALILAS